MSDFILSFRSDFPAERIAELLQGRPFMGDVPCRIRRWVWGTIIAQLPRCESYGPVDDGDGFYCCAGRPCLGGRLQSRISGARSLHGVADVCRQHFDPALYSDISGMFAICGASVSGAWIVTDRLGSVPLYEGRDSCGQLVAVGTNPELIATLADRVEDFDPVSLAELFLHESITFPYTTRRGVRQLAPGTLHVFSCASPADAPAYSRQLLWEPREPDRWQSFRDAADQLDAAIRRAGEDIASACDHVAVQMSGGLDSRAVAASIPRERLSACVTFLDWQNRETAIAAKVTEALGVPHVLVRRDPEMYARQIERALPLIGSEQIVIDAHGLCIADAGYGDRWDIIVGGFGCDILLKGAYVPYSLMQVQAHRWGLLDRARTPLLGKHNYTHEARRRQFITPALVHEAAARRSERLKQIRAIRPTSAEEWVHFYPFTQTTTCYCQTNLRTYRYDELFLHRDIVNCSAAARQTWKKSRWLVRRVFPRIAGKRMCRIEDASSGVPASASYTERWIAQRRKLGYASSTSISSDGASAASRPWFSQHSWVNYGALLRESAQWSRVRAHWMGQSQAESVLSRIFVHEPKTIAGGEDRADPFAGFLVVQIAALISLSLRSGQQAGTAALVG